MGVRDGGTRGTKYRDMTGRGSAGTREKDGIDEV